MLEIIFFLLFGYLLNMFYITVLYHRGLAHSAVELSPFAKFLIKHTGHLVTGLDPLAWSCMHRMHHMYSDKEKDPHSPLTYGVFGVALAQLRSYQKTIDALLNKDKEYTKVVADIDLEVSFLKKKGLWFIPYLLHIIIGVLISLYFSSLWPGLAYYIGITSHPFQGWLVNSFAHKYGYRNFKTTDNSKNNVLVALLTCGEGYQNNHHAHPKSAKFRKFLYEPDLGYLMCKIAQVFGVLRVKKQYLI